MDSRWSRRGPPPPSESLLRLQAIGLELPEARSSSLTIPSYSTSLSSNLDKPLPLEPHEYDKRTSSIYSFNTTITNIINMYGGTGDDDLPPLSEYHHAQAYRDTIAPILTKQVSLPQMSNAPPVPPRLRMSTSIPIMKAHYSPKSAADNANARNFTEFARNMRDHHNQTASPMSAISYDKYRQAAFNQLNATAPDLPPVPHDKSTSFLPGPMSANITEVVSHDVVPVPIDLNRSSDFILPPQEAARRAQAQYAEAQYADPFADPPERRHTTDSWETDSFVIYTGIREGLKHKLGQKLRKFKKPKQSSTSDAASTTSSAADRHRILSYASQKYPGMSLPHSNTTPVTAVHRSFRGSSSGDSSRMSRRASDLVRILSGAHRANTDGHQPAPPRRREKQRAVPLTSYQKYGAEVWFAKNKKERIKRKKARRAAEREEHLLQEQKERGETGKRQRTSQATSGTSRSGVANDYHAGQNQLVGVLGRLTRSASEKRREKLKSSIKMVGKDVVGKKEEESWL